MNTVGIVIGVFFLICVLVGWIQGLFKVIVSAAGLIASIVIAVYVSPYVAGFIEDNTKIDDNIAAYISTQLSFSDETSADSKSAQIEVINGLELPEGIKSNMLDNNNSEMYEALDAIGVYDYISKSIAVVIVNASVFILLIIICRIFFFFLGKAVGGFANLPIVRWIDKIGGGGLGAIKAVLFTWIFFLIISIMSTTSWSQMIIMQINDSFWLKLLYDNNILLDIVGDLTKVLFL